MHRDLRFIVLLPLLLISLGFQGPQPRSLEYNLKAAFLYRFIDYIELNQDAGPDVVQIAVLGDSEITLPLAEIGREQKAGKRLVVIRQAQSVNDISNCQIIFVSRNYKFPVSAVQAKFADKPILIVSEQKGDLEKGSHINFLIAENKLKFEVNLRTASKAGIKIGSQLLQHALAIKR